MRRRRLKSSIILQQSRCTVGHGIVRGLPNAYTGGGGARLYFVLLLFSFIHFNIKSERKRMQPSLILVTGPVPVFLLGP